MFFISFPNLVLASPHRQLGLLLWACKWSSKGYIGVGWLVGWLVGWMVGCLFGLMSTRRGSREKAAFSTNSGKLSTMEDLRNIGMCVNSFMHFLSKTTHISFLLKLPLQTSDSNLQLQTDIWWMLYICLDTEGFYAVHCQLFLEFLLHKYI